MEKLYIEGGKPLFGELDVASAKNSLLPILAGSVMCSGKIYLKKCSLYADVIYMIKILQDLGCLVDVVDENIFIDSSVASSYFVSEEYTKKVRSSVFMLGPLLTKFRKARVAYPGGCNIGSRPIDLHLKGLETLNVKIEEKHGYINCDGENMKAGVVHLDFPSVGATENIMMACVCLKGKSVIHNAAREPEIIDLQNFINAMGGKIKGAGTSTIIIEGVDSLKSCEFEPIKDRIIAGTYLIACAMAGGKVLLHGSPQEHNLALITNLKQSGCKVICKNDDIFISSKGRLKSIPKIDTHPFPGFPTDLQNQILTLQTICRGTSVVNENLFETRFKIYTELKKMGADIQINNQSAIVRGVNKLYGANVVATDLRGGAGLVLAGLSAEGYTTVEDIYHIDRGYKNIENDFSMLGAEIKRIIY